MKYRIATISALLVTAGWFGVSLASDNVASNDVGFAGSFPYLGDGPLTDDRGIPIPRKQVLPSDPTVRPLA